MNIGGDRDAAGTRMGMEASERTQDGNGDGSEDGAGMGWERERGWRPMDEHKIGTGTGARTETIAVSGDGSGSGNGNVDGNGNPWTNTSRLEQE